MDLTASDVREVRFGTTRLRAGYRMGEVDEFLDQIEAAIGNYASQNQHLKDETGALRSQVQQLQARLESAHAELAAAQEQATIAAAPSGHDTVVVEESSGVVVVDPKTEGITDDLESTAENPVVAEIPNSDPSAQLRGVRDRMRTMLEKQLAEVDSVEIPGD